MISLAYIIPTIGRSTLGRAVDGIIRELWDADQLFVVADGPRDQARQIMHPRWRPNVYYLEIPHRGDWGSSAIDYATRLAKADYLCYLGDDDEIEPGALAAMRAVLSEFQEPRPVLFAMRHEGGRILSGTVKQCDVSGQQIVVPNDKTRLPRYAEGPAPNDHGFILRVEQAFGGLIFRPQVIARLEKMNQGDML